MNKFLVYFSLTASCAILNTAAHAATFTVSASFDQGLPITLQQEVVTANVNFNRAFESIEMVCFTPFFQNDLDPGEAFSIDPFPENFGTASFGWYNVGTSAVSSRRVCTMGGEIQEYLDGFHPTGISMSSGEATLVGLEVDITGDATPIISSPLPVFFDPDMQSCFEELTTQNGWTSAEEVTSIDCSNRNIQAVGNLGQLPNLTSLNLSNNPLDALDIMGLENTLNNLDLSNTRLFTLFDLQNLSALTQLRLNHVDYQSDSFMIESQLQQIILNNPGITELGIGGIALSEPFNFFMQLSPQIVALELSNMGLQTPPMELDQFPQLTHIDLSNNPLEAVGPLFGLENQIKHLNLSHTRLYDLGELTNLTALETLQLNDIRFSNTDPFMAEQSAQQLGQQVQQIAINNPNLQHLAINGIKIDDPFMLFSNLSSQISTLALGNTGLTMPVPTAQFPQLTHLDISNNPLEFLDSLQQLENQLEFLDVSGTKLQDLGDIISLNNLTALRMNDLPLNMIDPYMLETQIQSIISNNTQLTELAINGIALQDAMMLFNALSPEIRHLSLSDTGLDYIPVPLAQFAQLAAIDLSHNPLEWIGPLQGLENQLTAINLSHTKLYDLYDLTNLNNLESLQLNDIAFSGSPTTGIDSQVQQIMLNNPRLRALGINGIPINDAFDFFNQLPPETKMLSLGNTGLTQIPVPLDQFEALTHLDLSNNPITWVGPLQGLETTLISLDLSNTALYDLMDISSLRALETLYLNNIDMGMQDPVMTDDQLGQILNNNPGLKHIGINDITLMNPMMFFDLVSPNIETLALSNTGLNFIPMPAPNMFSALRSLDVSQNPISDLPLLQGLDQQLVYLDISNTNLFSLSELLDLRALKQLRINDVNLDPMAMPESDLQIIISNNSALTHLGINGIILPDYNMLLNILPPQIKSLEMQNTGVAFFSAPLDHLLDLDLSNNGGLMDVNLSVLPSLGTLTLVGNTHMPCEHLDFLESQRPDMNLVRPSECAALPPIAPSNLRITASTDNSISLSWDDLSDTETSFDLQRSSDGINWTNLALLGENVENYTDTNLSPITTYFYRVRALNSNGASSFSNEILEMTAPASIPEYCEAQGLRTNYEWIDAVEVNGVRVNSGNNNGYHDNTNSSLSATAGSTTLITLVPGFRWGSYTERWSVWVDYNNDGTFQNSERIVQNSSRGTINTNFVVPPQTSGNLRMRVAMRWGSDPAACGNFTWGEVEDFTLQIQ